MLSIGRLGPGAADYHLTAVASGAEDYYLRDGEEPGRWLGHGRSPGLFSLPYRFSPGTAPFTVPMRVVVPRERGWPFLPVVARRFDVAVG